MWEGFIIFKRLCFLIGIFLPSALHAGDLPSIQFSIQPNLCVLAEEEERCHDELHIRWHSEVLQSLCLYQSNKRLPLRCWENETSGEHHIKISASKNIDFQLQDMSEQDLVVTQSFIVVQEDREYRRRRRNPWSFF